MSLNIYTLCNTRDALGTPNMDKFDSWHSRFTGKCRSEHHLPSPCPGCSQEKRRWEPEHCFLPFLQDNQHLLLSFKPLEGGLTVPGNHLLGALDALGLVVLAVDRRLGRSQLAVGGRSGNVAAVVGHVHVGLAAYSSLISLWPNSL